MLIKATLGLAALAAAQIVYLQATTDKAAAIDRYIATIDCSHPLPADANDDMVKARAYHCVSLTDIRKDILGHE